jgi:SAM-dependent methyltransferase
MSASEIRALARRAGVGPEATVLDVCCGTAGPGAMLTRELGCAYLGVDASPSAIALARERAGAAPCRFAVAHVPPLPPGAFDVVLLLETLLAFRDKEPLMHAIAGALRPGGRFACTLEAGPPLTAAERAAMPDADTVWPTPLDDLVRSLTRAGLSVTWIEDHSRAHRVQAQALAAAFAADAVAVAAGVGRRALDELLAAHRLWIEWLDAGRIRKLALVAEARARRGRPTAPARAPRAGSPPRAGPSRTPRPARARPRPPRAAAPPRP